MNITQTQKSELLASIKINMVKADYEPEVAKALKDYQRKAAIPGFRPGKAPMGMINKMYGASVMMDQLNKKVSEALNKHILDNKLNLIGYPLPDAEQESIDPEHNEEVTFSFEAALKPQITPELAKCKVTRYIIKASNEIVDKTIENILKSNPKHINTEHVEAESIIEATANNKHITINIAEVNEASRNAFIGKAVSESLTTDFAAALGEEKAKKLLGENAAMVDTITINEIYHEEAAELNEELFNKILPGKDIKDIDTFKQKVAEEIEKQYAEESDRVFLNQAIDTLVENTPFELPDAFLKRWIVENSEGKITAEQVEEQYEKSMVKGLRWQLIEEAIAKANNELIVKEEEIREHVRKYFFKGLDYDTMDEEMKKRIDGIVDNVLKRDEDRQNIVNQVADEKISAFLKANMKVTEKEIDYEGFEKTVIEEANKKSE